MLLRQLNLGENRNFGGNDLDAARSGESGTEAGLRGQRTSDCPGQRNHIRLIRDPPQSSVRVTEAFAVSQWRSE